MSTPSGEALIVAHCNSLPKHNISTRRSYTQSSSDKEQERSRLQEDLDMSKQCLKVCKMAGEMSYQKIHTIREAIAEDNSDQVVVTTVADRFDGKKTLSKGHSVQLVATLTPENFDRVISERYNSRSDVSPAVLFTQHTLTVASDDRRLPTLVPRRDKPNPNEIKRRHVDSESERCRK